MAQKETVPAEMSTEWKETAGIKKCRSCGELPTVRHAISEINGYLIECCDNKCDDVVLWQMVHGGNDA